MTGEFEEIEAPFWEIKDFPSFYVAYDEIYTHDGDNLTLFGLLVASAFPPVHESVPMSTETFTMLTENEFFQKFELMEAYTVIKNIPGIPGANEGEEMRIQFIFQSDPTGEFVVEFLWFDSDNMFDDEDYDENDLGQVPLLVVLQAINDGALV